MAQAHRLTPNQVNILILLCQGNRTQVVADILGVTIHSVRYDLRLLLAKLEAKTTPHAICIALQKRIIRFD